MYGVTMGGHLTVEQPTRGHGALEGYLARKRAQRANQLIPAELRNERLLDIGCGSYPFFLASTRFAEKWGVDQVFDTEVRLELGHEHVNLLPFDAQRDATLPFPADHFSVVTMLAVFEHIAMDSLVLLLTDIHRVLKPGGLYIATTPAYWTAGLLTTLAAVRLVSSEEIHEHKGAYRHADIKRALKQAGFQDDAVRQGYFELGMNTWSVASK
jgi:2-polyprenyl-3-methyl-5-hydroxy-6-metoxy-1,4-benzoquinol methylase